ncbi:thioesterase superfamily protein [Colletotrichum eremochloae]|nr:thioesterase superfamily protein [Colletotrichum eremochloae]
MATLLVLSKRLLRPSAWPAPIVEAHLVQSSGRYRQVCIRRYHPGVGADSAAQPIRTPSRFRRVIAFSAFGLLFAGLGFTAAASPLVPGLLDVTRHRSDEDSLRAYVPEDDEAQAVNDFINGHPLAAEMRQNPDMIESRPHMRLPDVLRRHNLTGGTLLGPGRITVPPVCWTEKGGRSLVSISHLGTDVCGHPGIVHGGLLATMLDEGLARCCFAALPHNVGVTAKLEINYRKPVHAGTYVVLRARTIRVEGRKAWVEGQLETLAANGEEPVVLAQASALFVSPRFASVGYFLHSTSHDSMNDTSNRLWRSSMQLLERPMFQE